MPEKKELHDKKKKAIESLANVICKTMKDNGECVVTDFVHDLANVAMFTELNSQIMATQIDKMQTEIDLLKQENRRYQIKLYELSNKLRNMKRGV